MKAEPERVGSAWAMLPLNLGGIEQVRPPFGGIGRSHEFGVVDDDHRFDGGAVPAVAWIAGDCKNLVHMPHIGYKVRIGGRCVLLPCQISHFCIHDCCRQ